MISLRVMLTCIGVTSPNVSVLRDFLGFARGRVPTDPDTSVTASISLNTAVHDVMNRHFHLNVIRVGYDVIPAADRRDAEEKLDYAVYKARNIYRQHSFGIGRVRHWQINAADADGADTIASEGEAEDLWRAWSVDDDGLDVFVVRDITTTDFIGYSPIGGDCDKGSKDDGTLGGGNNRDFDGLARTFSHEMGHFLGLSHNHGDDCPTGGADRSNLMAQTRCAGSPGPGVRAATVILADQANTIRNHCKMKAAC